MNEKMVARLIQSKVPYIVYQTEVFSEHGVNYVKEWAGKSGENLQRQNVYLQALGHALTVWNVLILTSDS